MAEFKYEITQELGVLSEAKSGWTDVEKFNMAIENKLNYIAIYPEDFDNFINKLKENKL